MGDSETKKDNKKGLGNVLRLLRIANDLTIKELAEKMDVSSTYISEIEANNKKPSLEIITKYSNVLNVNRSSIMFFDEEGEKNGYNYQKLLLDILQRIVEKKSTP